MPGRCFEQGDALRVDILPEKGDDSEQPFLFRDHRTSDGASDDFTLQGGRDRLQEIRLPDSILAI